MYDITYNIELDIMTLEEELKQTTNELTKECIREMIKEKQEQLYNIEKRLLEQ